MRTIGKARHPRTTPITALLAIVVTVLGLQLPYAGHAAAAAVPADLLSAVSTGRGADRLDAPHVIASRTAAPAKQQPRARANPPAAVASAPDITCTGTGWERRRGQAALASLRPAPMPVYSLSFLPAMTGFYGLTRPSVEAIEVYVRPCDTETDTLLRHVISHELGHAWDKTHLSEGQQAAYRRARGIPAGTPWQGCSRCADFATPAGDFAETYSQWRRGATGSLTQIANPATPAELAALSVQFFGG